MKLKEVLSWLVHSISVINLDDINQDRADVFSERMHFKNVAEVMKPRHDNQSMKLK
jgi:hypothetical protein